MPVFSRATASLAALTIALLAGGPLAGCGTGESKADPAARPCANGNTLTCRCSCDGKETTFNACFTAVGCDDFVGKACTDAGGPASTFGSCVLVEELDQCCM